MCRMYAFVRGRQLEGTFPATLRAAFGCQRDADSEGLGHAAGTAWPYDGDAAQLAAGGAWRHGCTREAMLGSSLTGGSRSLDDGRACWLKEVPFVAAFETDGELEWLRRRCNREPGHRSSQWLAHHPDHWLRRLARRAQVRQLLGSRLVTARLRYTCHTRTGVTSAGGLVSGFGFAPPRQPARGPVSSCRVRRTPSVEPDASHRGDRGPRHGRDNWLGADRPTSNEPRARGPVVVRIPRDRLRAGGPGRFRLSPTWSGLPLRPGLQTAGLGSSPSPQQDRILANSG